MSMIINPFVFGAAAAFDPTDIANLGAWWKFDRGVTEVSNEISQIDDNSGNGIDLVQSNASNKPTLTTGGANGQPYGDFDGSDYLSNITMTDQTANTVSFFFVGDLTTLGSTRVALYLQTDANALIQRMRFTTGSGGTVQHSPGGGDTATIVKTVTGLSAYIGRCSYSDDTNILDDLANEGTATASAASQTSIGRVTICSNSATSASAAWLGRVYEAGYYLEDISDADRTLLMNYLKSEYGL